MKNFNVYLLSIIMICFFSACDSNDTEIEQTEITNEEPAEDSKINFNETDIFLKANINLGNYTTSISKAPAIVYNTTFSEFDFTIEYILQGELIETLTSDYSNINDVCGIHACFNLETRTFNNGIDFEFRLRATYNDFPIENTVSYLVDGYSTSMEMVASDSTVDTCEACVIKLENYPFDTMVVDIPTVKVNFIRDNDNGVFSLKIEDNHHTDDFYTYVDAINVPIEEWRTIFDGIDTRILSSERNGGGRKYVLTYPKGGSVTFDK